MRRVYCLSAAVRKYSSIRKSAVSFKGSSHGSGFCMCGFCSFGKLPQTTDNTILKYDQEDPFAQINPISEDTSANIEQMGQETDSQVLRNLRLQDMIDKLQSSKVVDDVELHNIQLQQEINKLKAQLVKVDPHSIRSNVLKEDPDIAMLLQNNQNWVTSQKEMDSNYFSRIGGPQKPKYL